MAGKDEKAKKRKRDVNERGPKSKRRRSDQKEGKTNGVASSRRRNSSRKGSTPKSDAVVEAPSAQVSNGSYELEVIPELGEGDGGWRVSKPMGGRMLDIDPILTQDEQYLILAFNTTIQVYSASNSLLVRRIPISTVDSTASNPSKQKHIVAIQLSKQNPDTVWVASSDGRIYHINWTRAGQPLGNFRTKSGSAKDMSVVPSTVSDKDDDVILIVESVQPNQLDVVAYQGAVSAKTESKKILTLGKSGIGLQLLKSSEDGQVLVGALRDRLFIGVGSQQKVDNFDQLSYEFFSFDAPDLVACLDFRVESTASTGGKRKGTVNTGPVVNVIVGGARGGIYPYHDVLKKAQALGNGGPEKDAIQAQKYHWHRRAVHSVKWSRDGNYIISGGSENVLVLWQLDTAVRDYLPHLSGSVENIVVSSSGSSYVLHLDDNSTMIISTAEMKPIAYISGIQSAASNTSIPKDQLVRRVWTAPDRVRRLIPAAVSPITPSKLYVCVANGQQSAMAGDFSAPMLQSFDLETFTSTSKQALARTQPTDVNITNDGNPISEPLVTNISFSHDGKWLASVDQWQPPERDLNNASSDLRDHFIRDRHETYLKFWEVRGPDEALALVSRINTPHATNSQEGLLDLASNPVETCFATIGTDATVRLWRPKPRQLDGTVVKGTDGKGTFSWNCSYSVALGDGLGQGSAVALLNQTSAMKSQGKITFSEDGSTIFAAFGTLDTGAVYIIDASSGEIVQTLEGLWTGQLHSIGVLSPFVVVLSDQLRVYDVVGDELRYGITVPKPAKMGLCLLAVDRASGHFAVTVPKGDFSSIGIFSPEEADPLLVRSIPQHVVNLISSPTTSGFIALDDAAQIWVIAEASNPASLDAVQPLEELHLDGSDDARTELEGTGAEDLDMASDKDEEDGPDEDDGDDAYPSVVAPQRLAEIFDAAPAFAAPSIEDMFYKVTSLLATKPLSASSA